MKEKGKWEGRNVRRRGLKEMEECEEKESRRIL